MGAEREEKEKRKRRRRRGRGRGKRAMGCSERVRRDMKRPRGAFLIDESRRRAAIGVSPKVRNTGAHRLPRSQVFPTGRDHQGGKGGHKREMR